MTDHPLQGFREFTELDWQAFAGCESANPLINETRDDMVVVLDGCTVMALYQDFWYQKEFPTRQLAEDFAGIAMNVRRAETLALLLDDAKGGI